MAISKEELKQEWDLWDPSDKPWYCSHCDTLLSKKEVPECDGTDPFIPESEWKKHPPQKASASIEFEQFSEIMKRWFDSVDLNKSKSEYIQFEEPKLKTATELFKEPKLSKELELLLEEQIGVQISKTEPEE